MHDIFKPAFFALLNYSNVNQLLVYCLLNSHDHETLYTTATMITAETGLSRRTIRTCLDKLVKSGEISMETTNKFSIISLLKFNDYINKSAIIDKPYFYYCSCMMCHRKRAIHEGKK